MMLIGKAGSLSRVYVRTTKQIVELQCQGERSSAVEL